MYFYLKVFQVHPEYVQLNPAFREYGERSARVDEVLQKWRTDGKFITLRGWREECYEVRAQFNTPPLFKMDRSATCKIYPPITSKIRPNDKSHKNKQKSLKESIHRLPEYKKNDYEDTISLTFLIFREKNNVFFSGKRRMRNVQTSDHALIECPWNICFVKFFDLAYRPICGQNAKRFAKIVRSLCS